MNDRIRSEASDSLGANAWVIDEMRDLWAADPASVDEAWRALFEGETPDAPITSTPPPASTAARTTIDTTATDVTEPVVDSAAMSVPLAGEPPPPPAPKEAKKEPATDTPIGEPIKGVGARIVSNMEASLTVPTATSFREVPAKLLEVNRKVINGHLSRKMVRKISFTHLIGYAVVRAIADTVPAMNNVYATDAAGKPRIVRPEHIGLGIAVDIARDDGTRSLMVPCIRDAATKPIPVSLSVSRIPGLSVGFADCQLQFPEDTERMMTICLCYDKLPSSHKAKRSPCNIWPTAWYSLALVISRGSIVLLARLALVVALGLGGRLSLH